MARKSVVVKLAETNIGDGFLLYAKHLISFAFKHGSASMLKIGDDSLLEFIIRYKAGEWDEEKPQQRNIKLLKTDVVEYEKQFFSIDSVSRCPATKMVYVTATRMAA